MKSDMSSKDDEQAKNKKRKQQPTHEKKKKRKRDMDKLFDARFGRFLSRKKKNKKTESSSRDDPVYVECMKRARQLKGKTLNLSELLFSKNRDFLVTYNDRNRPVQAMDLEGKVIVLHFVSLNSRAGDLTYRTSILRDMYHVLHPKGGFEVVLIGVSVDATASSNPDTLLLHQSTLQTYFLSCHGLPSRSPISNPVNIGKVYFPILLLDILTREQGFGERC